MSITVYLRTYLHDGPSERTVRRRVRAATNAALQDIIAAAASQTSSFHTPQLDEVHKYVDIQQTATPDDNTADTQQPNVLAASDHFSTQTSVDVTEAHTTGDNSSHERSFNLQYESDDIGYDSDKDGNIGDDSSGDEECIQAQDADMDMRSQLAQWKLRYGVTDVAMNALLSILKPLHPRLPKDTRTIVPPPKNVIMKPITGGTYHHFGLQAAICNAMRGCNLYDGAQLSLQLGIDGLPVHKSSNMHLWPILGLIENRGQEFMRVFVVGIFYGDSKPQSCTEFLQDFCDEYATLTAQPALINGARVDLKLSSIICDAQARAFVKCTRAYNHKKGCDKCEEKGERHGRTVFLGQTARLRTDASFRDKRDPLHHRRDKLTREYIISPLEALGIGMWVWCVCVCVTCVCCSVFYFSNISLNNFTLSSANT